jgi:hypothetical protein
MGSLGLLVGACQYGRANWRAAGVRVSIYIDACRRHLDAYFEGEDLDPDSGAPHLAHALACLAVLVDAGAAGKLTDDRAFTGGYRKLVTELTPHVERIKKKYEGKSPKHWTIADAPRSPEWRFEDGFPSGALMYEIGTPPIEGTPKASEKRAPTVAADIRYAHPVTALQAELEAAQAGRKAIEFAWGIIANAHGGDWSKATPEWREAAEKWRDEHVTRRA